MIDEEYPVTKSLSEAEIRVRYESGDDVEEIIGIYKGTQVFLSEDRYFVIITIDKKKDIDRLIPVDNIVWVDVLKAKHIDIDSEKQTAYHG